MNPRHRVLIDAAPAPPPAAGPRLPAARPTPRDQPMPPHRRRFLAPLALLALGAAALFAARDRVLPPPPPWWQATWIPAGGEATPQLDLEARGNAPAGQLVLPYGADGRFHASLAVRGGEARNDTLLLLIEPETPAAAGPLALNGWDPPPRPAFAGREALYVLRRTGAGQAALFRLWEPAESGQVRVIRPDVPTGRPVLFPADLSRHTKVADLVAAAGGPK